MLSVIGMLVNSYTQSEQFCKLLQSHMGTKLYIDHIGGAYQGLGGYIRHVLHADNSAFT